MLTVTVTGTGHTVQADSNGIQIRIGENFENRKKLKQFEEILKINNNNY